MCNFLRVVLFTALISGTIIPAQKVEHPSMSAHLSQAGQETLLAQQTTTGTCGDSPTKGCGRRDSSAQRS